MARDSFWTILGVFLRLGLTSFGGPIAHLGYFREEFVVRRKWLEEAVYADLVALCQFLPGPASSQVGLSIGLSRGGLPGAFAAWLGFTLPSAIALVLFAYGVEALGTAAGATWLQGLKIVAVAVVAQAVWGMARSLCPDRDRATLAVAGTLMVIAIPGAVGQIAAIVMGGLAGWLWLGAGETKEASDLPIAISRGLAKACLAAFFLLLAGLPLLAALTDSQAVALVDAFYRAGSLVFGGGHVVLPLLEASVVAPGWLSQDDFLAGYGAAQAVPGPLFTFSAYLGAMLGPAPTGVAGAVLALLAIFVPSFLLVFGTLPYWAALRTYPAAQAVLRGVNAAVVGLLLAALYDPVWTSAITSPADFALAITAFLLLVFWRVPPWLVVILSALAAGLAPLAAAAIG
ncbi:MAG: chromate efflux transporter [Alphaproteobacteria bacterium]|jgi:chromate transporter|nr:chromate efflux transporter [Alphaproteobacteria bacterium]